MKNTIKMISVIVKEAGKGYPVFYKKGVLFCPFMQIEIDLGPEWWGSTAGELKDALKGQKTIEPKLYFHEGEDTPRLCVNGKFVSYLSALGQPEPFITDGFEVELPKTRFFNKEVGYLQQFCIRSGRLVTTNSHQLLSIPCNLQGDYSFRGEVIPSTWKKVKLSFGAEGKVIILGEWQIETTSNTYPNWEAVIPKETTAYYEITKEEFKSLILNEKVTIALKFGGRDIVREAEGYSPTSIPASEKFGGEVTAKYNSKLLWELLEGIESKNLIVRVKNERTPIVIEGIENREVGLVMPLRG